MIVGQDTLKELFYYIVSIKNGSFSLYDLDESIKNLGLSKYYPTYYVEAILIEGWIAGFLERIDNAKNVYADKANYKLSAQGKARADLISKSELVALTKMLMLED